MREDEPRQRVVRVPGSRRARLTPVPGTDTEPEAAVPGHDDGLAPASGPKEPNDDRLRQDVPPHY